MFSQVKSITFVQNILALILLGLVILFIFGSGNFGYIIGKNLVVSLLGGLLAYIFGRYIAEKSAFAKEKELLLQELDDVYSRQLSLLVDVEASSHQEELLAEKNEDLTKDLMEEKYRVEELMKVLDEYEARLRKAENENEKLKKKELQDLLIQRNKEVNDLKEQLKEKGSECARDAEVIRELKNQITDNEVYSGFLEEKVKYHEGERKKMKQKVSNLEGNLRELQKEATVLRAKNSDLRTGLEREAQKNLGMEEKVQKLKDENQCLQRDLAEMESQIVASMETLTVQRSKNEILAEEVRVMKNW
ncbi:epidermal growth factor receptor substrate 15-like [Macrobrachium rosenbergii]|uniref:epidermal growth factor receptor substrate 15-like n=1 Tax=Macrobrachium rosenbergii TaxID=79674 RepID=UPI0034D4B157